MGGFAGSCPLEPAEGAASLSLLWHPVAKTAQASSLTQTIRTRCHLEITRDA
jgi:hypothetical protein